MENIQTSELETEPQAVTPEIVTEMETQEVPSEEVDLDLEPNPTPEPPSPAPVDYKQKFVESQREAILLAEREKIKAEQIQKLTNIDTPTDDAMRQLYPDWDEYNEVTKRAFIKQEAQEMRQRRLEIELEDWRLEKRFNTELETVLENEPKLAGREAEFKKFASNPKNKGINPEVLAKAFLFDVEELQTPQVTTEALPQGSGGSREPLKSNKVSLEDAATIRKVSPSKYRELVLNDMIEDIE